MRFDASQCAAQKNRKCEFYTRREKIIIIERHRVNQWDRVCQHRKLGFVSLARVQYLVKVYGRETTLQDRRLAKKINIDSDDRCFEKLAVKHLRSRSSE